MAARAHALGAHEEPGGRLATRLSRIGRALLAAASSARYSWQALVIVARRVAVNVLGLALLIFSQGVPLCHGDHRGLPSGALDMLNFATLTDQALPAHLHPFLLSIVPHTQANIFALSFGSMLGWHNVPGMGMRSANEASTLEGSRKVQFAANLLGVAFTALTAAALTNKLASLGMCGSTEWLSVATALMAGSALSVLVCNLITMHGLGNGIGFVYVATIVNSAPR